ncbi:hypothetical protein DPMN_147447 [Dreissena polymorpha]|uniref:Uncharacterized protein n=1 Tax=Dreissena polymorpha TaxID=45954 RepID=A0A9D4F9V6_DREPO|nr:hypothetical protein DPMN_147447 [Dreissena polymorpha]
MTATGSIMMEFQNNITSISWYKMSPLFSSYFGNSNPPTISSRFHCLHRAFVSAFESEMSFDSGLASFPSFASLITPIAMSLS